MTWLDIETAPKDGTLLLLYCSHFAGEISGVNENAGIDIGSFSDGTSNFAGSDWWDSICGDYYATWCKPTHWMPLPDPPKAKGIEG